MSSSNVLFIVFPPFAFLICKDSLHLEIVHRRVGWEYGRLSFEMGIEEPQEAVGEGAILVSA